MKTSLVVLIGLACCVAGCDTIHGVSLTLSSAQANQMIRQCVLAGLRSDGLTLTEKNQGQIAVSEAGSNVWFDADFTKAGQVRFYRVQLHELLPCSSVAQLVTKMQAAAQAVQKACISSEIVVADAAYLGQEMCGFRSL